MTAALTLKKIFALLLALTFASAAHAGIVGWITAKERSWDYVQQTGGIRIGQPTQRDGKNILPVDYDPTGVTGVTLRPTVMNSGQAVRRIDVKRAGPGELVLTVVTQVVEETSNTGRAHFANLHDIPAGSYDVYYETSGDDARLVGKINIP